MLYIEDDTVPQRFLRISAEVMAPLGLYRPRPKVPAYIDLNTTPVHVPRHTTTG